MIAIKIVQECVFEMRFLGDGADQIAEDTAVAVRGLWVRASAGTIEWSGNEAEQDWGASLLLAENAG